MPLHTPISRKIAAATLALCVACAMAADLQVEIKNVKPGAGRVLLALFVQNGFLKSPVQKQALDATQGTLTHDFAGLEPGEYALSAFQDDNGNGKLDTNALGIPTELFAMSRQARGRMGPPTFDAAKFSVTDKAEKISIELK